MILAKRKLSSSSFVVPQGMEEVMNNVEIFKIKHRLGSYIYI